VVWCGAVRCGVVRCVVVWCGVVWCGVVWCGVVWCGVVWCGAVRCVVVWCGVVWSGQRSFWDFARGVWMWRRPSPTHTHSCTPDPSLVPGRWRLRWQRWVPAAQRCSASCRSQRWSTTSPESPSVTRLYRAVLAPPPRPRPRPRSCLSPSGRVVVANITCCTVRSLAAAAPRPLRGWEGEKVTSTVRLSLGG
jgi:hypothetical protein